LKINYFKINGFGKLANKEINLNNNINIIYGKNESGKSTMLSFIKAMFYGTSKLKNGKDISDYEKFLPWKTEDFTGKIRYTLDSGKTFEVYRDFKKKVPIIYNEKMQDISLDFNIDKSKGIDFIYEQIGLDEQTLNSTVITAQNDIKINKTGQNIIIQKMSNMVSSGDENISFKKTMDKINKLQNEQIGTDRTNQKPINIVNDKIDKLTKEKEKLEEYKNLLKNSIYELDSVGESELEEEAKLELFRKIKENLEKNKIKSVELEYIKKSKEEYENKIEELENKIDKKAKQKIRAEKKSFKKYWIIVAILLILSIIIFLNTGLSTIFPEAFGMLALIMATLTLSKINKFKKEKLDKINDIEEFEEKIKQEVNILENNKKELEIKIKDKEDEINRIRERENFEIRENFADRINKNFLDMVLEMHLEEILVSITNKEARINDLKLESQSKNLEKSQIQAKVDELVKIQEELDNAFQTKEELLKLNNSFNIAKECMEEAYEKIRTSLSIDFINELCSLSSKVSNGKYENINFNDEDGLMVEIEDGRFLPVERLSQGTIDQMYLVLRLSSINTISNENLPIILDETFAYFDDERLENILKFINEYYKNKQIIIFTCSNREKNILDKLKLQYNEVNI
jgi:recombinational DNA repair ATPase RecF